MSVQGCGPQGGFVLLWDRGELCRLVFCVCSRQGSVALRKFTNPLAAAATVMSWDVATSQCCQGKVTLAPGRPQCPEQLFGWLAQCRRILLIEASQPILCTLTGALVCSSLGVVRSADLCSTAQTMEPLCGAVCTAFSLAYSGYFLTHLTSK